MWERQLFKYNGPVLKFMVHFFYLFGIAEASFYLKALLWHIKKGKVKIKTIDDVFDSFYTGFLNVPPNKFIIYHKSKDSITVGSFHDCPILKMAALMGKDTRIVCRKVSKGPCTYFIRRLGSNVHLKNDYVYVRPHEKECIETLSIDRDLMV